MVQMEQIDSNVRLMEYKTEEDKELSIEMLILDGHIVLVEALICRLVAELLGDELGFKLIMPRKDTWVCHNSNEKCQYAREVTAILHVRVKTERTLLNQSLEFVYHPWILRETVLRMLQDKCQLRDD